MRLYRARNQQMLTAYFGLHACVDCGEADPTVLEFDHVRGKKLANVANMVRNGIQWSRIEMEIAKCEVRCANCHCRKTAKELGYKAGALRCKPNPTLFESGLGRAS